MADEGDIDALIAVIEDRWGEEVTGTRRKHLHEILEIVHDVAGEEAAEEVTRWASGKHADFPLETIRLHACAEHPITRDRFGFR